MDEGIIYEEGIPADIFDYPQKEKTKAFIHRIRNFYYHIADSNFDFYDLRAHMESFCNKHFFRHKEINDLNLIIEETLQLCFQEGKTKDRNKIVATTGGLEIAIIFSEQTNEKSIIFTADETLGSILNQVQDSDRLSLTIISGITQSIRAEIKKGKVVLTMVMK